MATITPFIYQVPTGMNLVLRNVWWSRSDSRQKASQEPEGYYVLHEGYVFWLPKLWHEVVGIIDMRPINRDPDSYEVNTIDGQRVGIDVRLTDRVMRGYGLKEVGDECHPPDQQPKKEKEDEEDEDSVEVSEDQPNNVLRFAIRVESEGATDRKPFISQVVTAAFNLATSNYPSVSYSLKDLEIITEVAFGPKQDQSSPNPTVDERIKRLAEQSRQVLDWGFWLDQGGNVKKDKKDQPKTKKGLAEFNKKELTKLGSEILAIANDELMCYGIKIERLQIQSIRVRGPLQAALERRTSSIVEAHSASAEKSYLIELLDLLPQDQQNIWATTLLIALNRGLDRVPDLIASFKGEAKKKSGK